jgi:hypothetical protein
MYRLIYTARLHLYIEPHSHPALYNGVYDQIVRTDKLRLTGPVRVYEATPIRGQSTDEAHADAKAWLVSLDKERVAGVNSHESNAQ